MTDIKRIDIKEFRELGFLQEVNRLILHPCGLALEIVVEEDGTERLGGVWDSRDDDEGIAYCWPEWSPESVEANDRYEKAANVTRERLRHKGSRIGLFARMYPNTVSTEPDIEPLPEFPRGNQR